MPTISPWPAALPSRLWRVGLAVMVVTAVVMFVLGDLLEIQAQTTTAGFERVAVEQGNGIRWASWIDIVVYVPAYVAFGLGVLLGVRPGPGEPLPTAARIGVAGLLAGATADQVENVAVQLGIGTVDLGADDARDQLAVDETIVDVLSVANGTKLASLLVALVAAIWAFWSRRRARSTTP